MRRGCALLWIFNEQGVFSWLVDSGSLIRVYWMFGGAGFKAGVVVEEPRSKRACSGREGRYRTTCYVAN